MILGERDKNETSMVNTTETKTINFQKCDNHLRGGRRNCVDVVLLVRSLRFCRLLFLDIFIFMHNGLALSGAHAVGASVLQRFGSFTRHRVRENVHR